MLERFNAIRPETEKDILPHLTSHRYPATKEWCYFVGDFSNTASYPFSGPLYVENTRKLVGSAEKVSRGTYSRLVSLQDVENETSLHKLHIGDVLGEEGGETVWFQHAEHSQLYVAAIGLHKYLSGVIQDEQTAAVVRWNEVVAEQDRRDQEMHEWIKAGMPGFGGEEI